MHSKKLYLLAIIFLVLIVIIAVAGMKNIKQDQISGLNQPANLASASLTLIAPISGSVNVGQNQTIKWLSNNYNVGAVKISLIRKVSENPLKYDLVRVIAENAPNTGSYIWTPASTDIGDNLSVQIGCVLSEKQCSVSSPSAQLSVIENDRYLNTANLRDALSK